MLQSNSNAEGGAGAERRRGARVRTSLPITVKTSVGDVHGLCTDVSYGGLGLETRGNPKVGAVVWIMIELPEGEVVTATAEVVRGSAPGEGPVGLRFVELGHTSLVALMSLVSGARVRPS